ncbi:hypothetical protein NE865_12512 [Phthorimaea operculella]|nr:hypothetical protein NE865_12512 [Phthorimaea operculella]
MSTSKGSQCRRRPQKHQNKTAFKNDLHDTSKKTKLINSLEVSGVCKRCRDIIQWKIKYKKYKPLTAPSKCVGCNEKAVKHAYHVLCSKCAAERKVCAKCAKEENDEKVIQTNKETNQDIELQAILKSLPERKRRTVLRHLRKNGEEEGTVSAEMRTQIEELLSGMKDFSLDDDDSDFDLSDEALTDEEI